MIKTLVGDLIPIQSRLGVYSEAAATLGVDPEDLTLFREEEILPEDHSELQPSEVLCALIEPFPYTITLNYGLQHAWSKPYHKLEQIKFFNIKAQLQVLRQEELVYENIFPMMGYMHNEQFVLQISKEPIFDTHLIAIKQLALPALYQEIHLEPRRQTALENRLELNLRELEKLLWKKISLPEPSQLRPITD
jgi:hypothetical protein